MAVKPIPDGYHRMNIHLSYKDATKAMEFYKKAFGAEQHGPIMPGPGGKGVMHAELRVGDTIFFLADDSMGRGTTVEGGQAKAFVPHLAVENVDAAWKRAVDAGCKVTMPIENMFWGDRYGQVEDPFGLTWALMQHVEDVPMEEMGKRAAKMFGGG
jgi:PhnB protein